jgi:hypothetical protein
MEIGLDLILGVVVSALALAVLATSAWRGTFYRYLYLNLYAVALVAFDALRYWGLQAYGLRSEGYFYLYYGTDLVLRLLFYLLILGLFEILFAGSALRVQIRAGLFLFYALIAGISYAFVQQAAGKKMYSRLMVEFQQNLHFGAVVLAVMLCITLAHLRIKDPQILLLSCGAGFLAGIQASVYAVMNLLPKDIYLALAEVTRRAPSVATLVMMAVSVYALARLTPLGAPAGEAPEAPVPLAPALAHGDGGR